MVLQTTKNIYLTGFMGCGKSTVGKILARLLKMSFFDTDSYIESKYKKKISQIFAEEGEESFRKLEEEAVKLASHQTGLVVSLGGGAILSEKNRKVIQKGYWIFLHAPLSVIKKRVMGSKKRPLAQKNEKDLEMLYLKRLPLYSLAKYKIYCQNHSSKVVSEKIIKILNKGFSGES